MVAFYPSREKLSQFVGGNLKQDMLASGQEMLTCAFYYLSTLIVRKIG